MEKRIYYLSNTVIPNTKREKNIHVFNVFSQVGVKQLTDFLRTVTAASDLVDCTLFNCVSNQCHIKSKMSLVVRKPVFGVSDQVIHKPAAQSQKIARSLKFCI